MARRKRMNDATFSPCRKYRYTLRRSWIGGAGACAFIGLNPSTADETKDDPTIRRCITYAKDWGYESLLMLNLFAFRATKPGDMMAAHDPIGPDNDAAIAEAVIKCAVVVAAWGANGRFWNRDFAVRRIVPKLHYLRLTSTGCPGHPLYLPKTLKPIEWCAL